MPRVSPETIVARGFRLLRLTLLMPLLLGSTTFAGDLEFNRDVQPILRETCYQCHGPDSGSRKGNLRLDRRDSAIESKAIVPGDVEKSEMIYRILSEDPEEVMPPPDSHHNLTAENKATLKRWVEQGAEYQPHWAFIAPRKVEPPAATDPAWSRSPIDRFLEARQRERGMAHSPEADRRTLARRASLDLIGLPPRPEEVDAFVADPSPDAYEKYVDHLLASPAWGEHRARYWLDAARYADTHGIHFDNYREIWSYRDWVINAFNANKPFDRFGTEQVAGDLMPNRSLDQAVASGFNRCNITTNEGGAINEEYLVLYARDRTETVSQVFLGLTTGCAVCHDHKFDPFSQKEFYELSAFFNNTTQRAMDGNVKDTPPTVFVPLKDDATRWGELGAEVASVEGRIADRRESLRPEFLEWLTKASPESLEGSISAEKLKLKAGLDAIDSPQSKTGQSLELADAGDFERDQPFSVGMWVKPSRAGLDGALLARMDDGNAFRGWDLWVEGGKVASHVIHKWPEDALKVVAEKPLNPNAWNHVLITYDGSSKASGLAIYYDGVRQPTRVAADQLKGTIRTEVPIKLGQRHRTSKVDDALYHDLRIYARSLDAGDAVALDAGSRAVRLKGLAAEARPAAEVDSVFRWYLSTHDQQIRDLTEQARRLGGEQKEIQGRGTIAHVMHERAEPAEAYVLFRGDYDKRRDKVGADTPDALPPMASDQPKNRLGLAAWLFDPGNPLTPRVTVNRFWQELFGNGLVRTSGDFGLSGEAPTHPELLDWLAVDFRESGWDVKRFYKQMVMSAAYRQAATTSPELAEKDPSNRYLARAPRFRMDAEMIRDYALAASGLLVDRVGGPSVRPYQPEGVWEAVAMPESNTRNYKRDSGDSLYRRSLYTLWKRAAPPASMDIFNAPAREVCTVRRERTNTPLQALVTLNDTQFIEAARKLASLTLDQGGATDRDRIDFMARRLLGRSLRSAEADQVESTLRLIEAEYRKDATEAAKLIAVGESKPDPKFDPATLAAWTMVSNELMNLDELLNK